jgi:hypothetical protein
MSPDALRNAQILKAERNAVLVFTAYPKSKYDRQTTVLAVGPLELRAAACQPQTGDPPIVVYHHAPIRPLVCHPRAAAIDSRHTACHSEPVPGGVQIQPAGRNWVGTLAGLCRIGPPGDPASYAALTNWHVADGTDESPLVPVHQPFTDRSRIATCDRYCRPRAGITNYADAAAGSCFVERKHTLARELLNLGLPSPMPVDLQTGDQVCKSGRTTGVTYGRVTGTGAATRVSYGDFEATFADQDVIEGTAGNFSAGGDSGSQILRCSDKSPAALLFAGGGNITIACPMRHVTEALGLLWPIIP